MHSAPRARAPRSEVYVWAPGRWAAVWPSRGAAAPAHTMCTINARTALWCARGGRGRGMGHRPGRCSRRRLRLLLAQLAKGVRVARRYDQCARDRVANRDGEHVLEEDVSEAEVGALEEAEREEKHVCDRVLEPDRDERRDREPDADHLARHVVGRARKPHGEADEPVAEDRLDEGGAEGRATLLDRRRRRQLRRPSRDDAAVVCGERKAGAADQIADKREEPALDEEREGDEAFVQRGGDGGGVAGEQLPARVQDEQQVHREKSGKEQLLQARVGRGNPGHVPGNHRREQPAEADVAAAHDGLVQDFQRVQLCIRRTLLRQAAVGLGRRLDRRN
mmetsp:Transcript_3080/g.8689  ORF Transcript_3080/g.8689 Transcript_3080/m.8689 type:complete len:335 (+) Transcript_3080:45-1049(+)